MISVDLVGRLGNQCFQIATCIAHAKRMKTDYCIPSRSMNSRIWPTYFKHFHRCGNRYLNFYKEPDFTYSPIPMEDNIRLHGYFQSEKYFMDYKEEIIKAFQIPYKRIEYVSIHVRREDYLQYQDKHPVLQLSYYQQAIKHFPRDTEFLIFSDDIGWCKETFIGFNHYFSEGKTPLEDLSLMSSCTHNIIANSSFSWWGAYLNQNPDKIVISPSVWFGSGNGHLNTSTLIPEEWIKI